MSITPDLVKELDAISEPGALLLELHKRYGKRMGIATSGQPTDTAIIALAVKAGVKKPRVYTTDTLRLFPETYAYYKKLEKLFKIRIERFTPPEKELTKMVEQHGEFLFYDSREKQEYCCHVRKVLPNLKALDSLDVWVTGLRRDQSASRADLARLEVIEHHQTTGGLRPILKVNPLVSWTEQQVADYLKANKIPNHPLFEKKLPGGRRYESLGCILCTTPIGPNEPRRAGRWRWFNALDDKKECGLHLSFLDVARDLAVQAAHRVTELRQSPLVRMRKPDRSLVTNADHEADKIIRAGLHKAFPDHAILTEESGMAGSPGAEYVWVVDPLDGTTAFAAGRPGYSVMIGLLKDGKPYAGVVVDPVEGHIYEAERARGTFHTLDNIRKRVHASLRGDLAIMPVITSTDFPPTLEERLRRSLPGPWIPAVNSVGIKVGFVARELADIYINHRSVHFWDLCAPQILLEEAGGTLTFWDGSPVDYPLTNGTYRHTMPTLATNGLRHRDILAVLKPLV